MSRTLLPLSISAAFLSTSAVAEVPNVAVDIAPIHSLVARVMEGIGEPKLIVQPGASPHGYSLRPSEATALQEADLVFWIGEDLAPWMGDAVETLAADAAVTTLLDAEETNLLEFREDALFEAHDHGEHDDHDTDEHGHDDAHEAEDHEESEEHGHDEHDHDDEHAEGKEHGHDDHADEDHAEHDDHGHDAHDHGDEHAHGDHDPHVWLSPQNASAWLNVMAAQLSAADPDNAGAYFANTAAARADLQTLSEEVNAILDPVRGRTFIVFHDAYQYFENDFDFPASGAISLGDASDPSPARIVEIQDRIREEGVDCVLAEPQFNPGIIATVLDGTEANTGVIDPLGASLTPGVDLYPQLISDMANALADCL